MQYFEVNFDGLVGPTHNYAGLALGNLASLKNAGIVSHPRQAALQGLRKMRLLYDMGIKQAVLPPHPRPNLDLLNNLGFNGDIKSMLKEVFEYNSALLATIYSASSMWTANAATVSPSCNTSDKKVHLTPANLASNTHRAQEAQYSYRILSQIFSSNEHFAVHQPLMSQEQFGDEGAANHCYISSGYGKAGVEVFVYGREYATSKTTAVTQKHPARQTLEASEAIARLHHLEASNTVFCQQSPTAIDSGAFHNDVVCVANNNVFLYHENAFANPEELQQELREKFDSEIHFVEIKAKDLSLEQAVKSYLFNSQIITKANGEMALIAPRESEEMSAAYNAIQSIIKGENPISEVHFVDCRESMQNGGGPACLRLRVVLSEEELKAVSGNVILDEGLFQSLEDWVKEHYREELTVNDLLDPKLHQEVQHAFANLGELLKLDLI